jgi:alkylation response protein AidB-like acyl-CoA dehydrogenase
LVARASGALAFLQTQHQSAVSLIAKGSNELLKQEMLPHMHGGDRLTGIGFSQLRRPGPPMCRATALEGGYRIDGAVPWITGWSIFPEFVIGAALPSGEAVFGVVPLVDAERHGGSVRFSAPMRLAAMESAQTVSGEFSNWWLADEHVVDVRPAGWIQNNDQINVTLQGHFAIGCAQAGLDIVAENAAKKKLSFISETFTLLNDEVLACRESLASSTPELADDERLRRRAWAIDLAVRCAHAGVVSSSGAANAFDHPAQRVYREALVFSVSAQTSAIMQATLSRLVRPKTQR